MREIEPSDLKRELSKYKLYKNKLKYIENKLVGVAGINYSKAPGTSLRTVEIKNLDLIDEKDTLEKKMRNIENFIKLLQNELHQTILECVYLDSLTIEATAKIIGFSFSYIQKEHRKAIFEATNKCNEIQYDFSDMS